MSASTREGFYTALRAYSQVTAEAALSGQLTSPSELADAAGLTAAAHAHIGASRPLDDVKDEYDALQAAVAEGEAVDYEVMQELADELQPARMAEAILGGSFPGTGHAASAGIGA
jgi:hypothetical protein